MRNPSVTIIVSHFNSMPFLRCCIRQLRRYQNPEVEQHIIISDQSNDGSQTTVDAEFGGQEDITIVHTDGLYSGYGIDYIIRNIQIDSDFICQLHVDAFPIHKNWLLMATGIMESFNLSFAGVMQFVCEKPEAIYPFKNPFFAMAQSFHVGRTKDYIEMAYQGGFTRFHNRPMDKTGMVWQNQDWANWASEDYQARGSDDDVPAFFWGDTYRIQNKIGLGITAKMGVHGEESGYGSIIEDMVFHFGFCRESIGVRDAMGKKYNEWTNRINAGFTDELIDEMLAVARQQPFNAEEKRVFWNGTTKQAQPPSKLINVIIEHLKITTVSWENLMK